jgi:hypothetical protein
MSTIRSTVNNPSSRGRVQVLNNLQTTMLKLTKEDEVMIVLSPFCHRCVHGRAGMFR